MTDRDSAGTLPAAHADAPFVRDPRLRIFLVSFTLLFFELLCIRWIPSYVRYLSYFTNFILLASFLGMGLGILSARRERFRFLSFPVMVLILVGVVAVTKFELVISSTSMMYYGITEAQAAQSERFYVLPLIFSLVALCFVPLSRQLGHLLAQTKPLTAYTFDIIGSLAGTAAFFLIAYFSLPPILWFAALALLILALGSKRTLLLTVAPLALTLAVVLQLQAGTYWSPYYKITLHPSDNQQGYVLDVNNTGHQEMVPWEQKESFYRRVYELFPGRNFDRVLIIGAGSGSDIATALAYQVNNITGVEIDPVIHRLGAELHPDRPFDDPRVKVVVDDGRAFLRNTDEKFDLVIFALPDSLTLTSSMANLRLESFLLTEESIASARRALTPDGVLVLYNYYREAWLVQKLANMVGNVFEQDPLVSTYGGWGRAAVIMAGPLLATLPPGSYGPYQEDQSPTQRLDLRVIGEGYFPRSGVPVATDDWPFVYLREPDFPSIYIAGLLVVGLISLLSVIVIAPRSTLRRFDWHMFFLGVAFSLLEVRALTTFALLFGSTWMVNSLVFFAILSGVLLAVFVNARFRIRRIGIFYALLFAMLVLNLVVRPETLLFHSAVLRYLVASVMTFAPVFLANVIFSNSFRDTEAADVAFASNLLGIMVGGTLEYFSMLFGYHFLLIPVIIFYACAMLLRRRAGSAVMEASGEGARA